MRTHTLSTVPHNIHTQHALSTVSHNIHHYNLCKFNSEVATCLTKHLMIKLLLHLSGGTAPLILNLSTRCSFWRSDACLCQITATVRCCSWCADTELCVLGCSWRGAVGCGKERDSQIDRQTDSWSLGNSKCNIAWLQWTLWAKVIGIDSAEGGNLTHFLLWKFTYDRIPSLTTKWH
jgi:hypothetical protein